MIAEIAELAILPQLAPIMQPDELVTLQRTARAVHALSLLACVAGSAVSEAEINPLIIKAEGAGVIAVDGLVVMQ
jgi:succinyl-CoA synthetase beta subunit